MSECMILDDLYEVDWWDWPNQEDFNYGYDIRNETLTV